VDEVHSSGIPSTAEYWHIGETQARFRNVTSRTRRGSNRPVTVTLKSDRSVASSGPRVVVVTVTKAGLADDEVGHRTAHLVGHAGRNAHEVSWIGVDRLTAIDLGPTPTFDDVVHPGGGA
jgi:hypothetical protein